MRARFNGSAMAAVAIAAMTMLSAVNAQVPPKQQEMAVGFDADALARTIKELKKTSNIDLFEMPLKDIVNQIAKLHKLEIRIEATDPAPVTINIKNESLGMALAKLLATVNCEYAIFPNGKILIREFNKMSSDAPSSGGIAK